MSTSYRDEIEDTCLTLEENFDTLYQRCLTSEQKKRLCDTHSVARYTLWKVGQEGRPNESSVGAPASQDLRMVNMRLNAMLKNLDRRIREETGLPVSIAEDPLASVVLGTGKMLTDFRLLRRVAIE